MRLLRLKDNGEFSLIEFVGSGIPPYAILSHTWGPDHEEVTLKDLLEGAGKNKAGYCKLIYCAKQAANDGLQFFWVDTCCIDKLSSAELAEAINSMFRWYHNAAKCYVYLSDVSIGSSVGHSHPPSQQTWKPAFRQSRWFTRGWTLQELLAPESVDFFSVEGKLLGNKNSLLQEIEDITRIPITALQGSPLLQFSIDERMSWAKGRETKREEDAAYSLLGIFDIHMPLIYGEGRKKALARLQKEIQETLKDELSAPPPAYEERANGGIVNRSIQADEWNTARSAAQWDVRSLYPNPSPNPQDTGATLITGGFGSGAFVSKGIATGGKGKGARYETRSFSRKKYVAGDGIGGNAAGIGGVGGVGKGGQTYDGRSPSQCCCM